MVTFTSKEELREAVSGLRRKLDPAFSPATAIPGTASNIPSAGHCAAVAAIVHREFGGELVSTMVSGISHWFNRFTINGTTVDVDITGDQFGFSAVRMAEQDQLFGGTRIRQPGELNDETRRRSALLAQRAGIDS